MKGKFKKGVAKNLVFLVLTVALLVTVISVIRVTGSSDVTLYFNSADFIKGTDLEISPTELTLEATSGTTITKEFLVTNKGNEAVYLSTSISNIDGVIITINPTSANLEPGISYVFTATIEIPEDIGGPYILAPDDDCPTPNGFGGGNDPKVAWGCSGKKKSDCPIGQEKPHNEISDLCDNNCCSVNSCGLNEC